LARLWSWTSFPTIASRLKAILGGIGGLEKYLTPLYTVCHKTTYRINTKMAKSPKKSPKAKLTASQRKAEAKRALTDSEKERLQRS
jgi:hypothetical protein